MDDLAERLGLDRPRSGAGTRTAGRRHAAGPDHELRARRVLRRGRARHPPAADRPGRAGPGVGYAGMFHVAAARVYARRLRAIVKLDDFGKVT
jgi:hypothetical protein